MSSDKGQPIVVCSKGESHFADSIKGRCAKCSAPITWRPHNPEPSTKMCIDCVLIDLKESGENPEFRITEETANEVMMVLDAMKPVETDDPWEA